MSDNPIDTASQESYLSDEERRIFAHPSTAKFRVFHEGEFYQVGRMLGMDAQVVTNPLHAFGCVAFLGRWTMIPCRPGDIEAIREGRPWI